MRKLRLFAFPALLAIALAPALSACGQAPAGQGSDGGSYTTPDVTMGGYDFDHNRLTIPAGTRVKFINPASAALHILCVGENAQCDTSAPGPSELSGGHSLSIAPGETKAVTFDMPGTYKIACTLHPMMNLTITVR